MTRIVQITDSHLGATDAYRLAGVDTSATFNSVLEQVRGEDFDLVLATGDIASEANATAYASFFSRVATLDRPLMWLPGNHDRVEVIAGVEGAPEFAECRDIGTWRIIMLNSVIEHRCNGCLGDEEQKKLRRLLAENRQDHVLVCLHHQPVDVGSAWIDRQKIEDADEFLDIISATPAVRAVFWGHVHQEFSCTIDDRPFCATPSTCVQFKANCDDFTLDDQFPGYRMIELKADGSIETEVVRVELEDYAVDINCAGY